MKGSLLPPSIQNESLALRDPYKTWIHGASSVLEYIFLLRHIDSVVDFGCNCGPWLKAAMDFGVEDVAGVDLRPHRDDLLFPSAKYLGHDLSKPLNLDRKYDLVIGLEVAEHLPDGDVGAESYVNTLSQHGDFILFSAATPGQGGTGHLNEQPHAYWHEKFSHRGYRPLDIVRPLICNLPQVAWWYKKNLFLYVKPQNHVSELPGTVPRSTFVKVYYSDS